MPDQIEPRTYHRIMSSQSPQRDRRCIAVCLGTAHKPERTENALRIPRNKNRVAQKRAQVVTPDWHKHDGTIQYNLGRESEPRSGVRIGPPIAIDFLPFPFAFLC